MLILTRGPQAGIRRQIRADWLPDQGRPTYSALISRRKSIIGWCGDLGLRTFPCYNIRLDQKSSASLVRLLTGIEVGVRGGSERCLSGRACYL